MTLTELRRLVSETSSPDFLDRVAAHNCGVAEIAIGALGALSDAIKVIDQLEAELAAARAENGQKSRG